MTHDEFGKIVAFCEGAFRGDVSPKERDAWWLLLHDEPAAQVMARAVALAKSPERARYGMPKPGELLEENDAQARALVAWDALLGAANDPYPSLEFEDEVLSAVVDSMGGWLAVCRMPLWGDGLRFAQKDFERTYIAFAKAGRRGPKHHIGLEEEHNGTRWPELTRTITVADPFAETKVLPAAKPLQLVGVEAVNQLVVGSKEQEGE